MFYHDIGLHKLWLWHTAGWHSNHTKLIWIGTRGTPALFCRCHPSGTWHHWVIYIHLIHSTVWSSTVQCVLTVSFTQLQSKYNLPGSSFFRFLQIRDYARTYLQNFETFTGSCLGRCLQSISCSETSILHIYDSLQSISPVNSTLIKQHGGKGALRFQTLYRRRV